ncbi:MAG TPA: CU044_2847 family protein [Candidatus Bathyarchaeia archaeon]|nr:CU044_2847 family protein [Candidatus Bathyarchaeia archaeon]
MTLIKCLLQDGNSILIEVKQEGLASDIGQSLAEPIEGQREFNKALNTVNAVAKSIFDNLVDSEAQHVAVVFGIKFNERSDVIIASGSLDANFQVTLSWDEENKPSYREWID